jgi:class 3 adenylate cyclase
VSGTPNKSLSAAESEALSEKYALQDTVKRAALFSFLLAVSFAIYSFTSIDFIRRFDPSVTLWANTWPRLLFSFLPLCGLGLFMSRAKVKDRTKLLVWIFVFACTLHVASWIHVWPIALSRSALILTYVHAANLWLYAIVFAGVGPPRSMLVAFTSTLVSIFILPLVVVGYLAGDAVVFYMFVNESALAISALLVLSRILDSLRVEVSRVRAMKEFQARQFLGPVVGEAIFDEASSQLDTVRCKGFIVSIDVRDSTELQRKYPEVWKQFRKEYFNLVSRLVGEHHGYIQKTVGDCHVINFGVMDYGVDLTDVPDIDSSIKRAEERRLQRASDRTFAFLEALFQRFAELSGKFAPHFSVALGAGVDKGLVERGIQGDSTHNLELDVNGDPVNCSNRLQEYSKLIRKRHPQMGSIVVLSPYACDYLKDFENYMRIQTIDDPIRNYPGIRWVLVRPFSAEVKKPRQSQSAA